MKKYTAEIKMVKYLTLQFSAENDIDAEKQASDYADDYDWDDAEFEVKEKLLKQDKK